MTIEIFLCNFFGGSKCGFHGSGYGLQVPMIFHDVSVGCNVSHYSFKRHRVPHFLLNLIHFSRFTPFLPTFPSFVPSTPILGVLCFGLFLLTPNFHSSKEGAGPPFTYLLFAFEVFSRDTKSLGGGEGGKFLKDISDSSMSSLLIDLASSNLVDTLLNLS